MRVVKHTLAILCRKILFSAGVPFLESPGIH